MDAFCSALGRVPCVLPMVSRSEAWRWPLSTQATNATAFFHFYFFMVDSMVASLLPFLDPVLESLRVEVEMLWVGEAGL